MSANKLSTAQEYVRSNYIGTGRLRYDLLSEKLQIKDPNPEPFPSKGKGELTPLPSKEGMGVGLWQDLDTRWINTMAVECANETGVSVSDKEIRIVLNSHVVPAINPLRDWLQSLPEYTPSKSSFIDWLAGQVHVKDPNPTFPSEGKEEAAPLPSREGMGGWFGSIASRSGSWRWWRVGCMTRW